MNSIDFSLDLEKILNKNKNNTDLLNEKNKELFELNTFQRQTLSFIEIINDTQKFNSFIFKNDNFTEIFHTILENSKINENTIQKIDEAIKSDKLVILKDLLTDKEYAEIKSEANILKNETNSKTSITSKFINSLYENKEFFVNSFMLYFLENNRNNSVEATNSINNLPYSNEIIEELKILSEGNLTKYIDTKKNNIYSFKFFERLYENNVDNNDFNNLSFESKIELYSTYLAKLGKKTNIINNLKKQNIFSNKIEQIKKHIQFSDKFIDNSITRAENFFKNNAYLNREDFESIKIPFKFNGINSEYKFEDIKQYFITEINSLNNNNEFFYSNISILSEKFDKFKSLIPEKNQEIFAKLDNPDILEQSEILEIENLLEKIEVFSFFKTNADAILKRKDFIISKGEMLEDTEIALFDNFHSTIINMSVEEYLKEPKNINLLFEELNSFYLNTLPDAENLTTEETEEYLSINKSYTNMSNENMYFRSKLNYSDDRNYLINNLKNGIEKFKEQDLNSFQKYTLLIMLNETKNTFEKLEENLSKLETRKNHISTNQFDKETREFSIEANKSKYKYMYLHSNILKIDNFALYEDLEKLDEKNYIGRLNVLVKLKSVYEDFQLEEEKNEISKEIVKNIELMLFEDLEEAEISDIVNNPQKVLHIKHLLNSKKQYTDLDFLEEFNDSELTNILNNTLSLEFHAKQGHTYNKNKKSLIIFQDLLKEISVSNELTLEGFEEKSKEDIQKCITLLKSSNVSNIIDNFNSIKEILHNDYNEKLINKFNTIVKEKGDNNLIELSLSQKINKFEVLFNSTEVSTSDKVKFLFHEIVNDKEFEKYINIEDSKLTSNAFLYKTLETMLKDRNFSNFNEDLLNEYIDIFNSIEFNAQKQYDRNQERFIKALENEIFEDLTISDNNRGKLKEEFQTAMYVNLGLTENNIADLSNEQLYTIIKSYNNSILEQFNILDFNDFKKKLSFDYDKFRKNKLFYATVFAPTAEEKEEQLIEAENIFEGRKILTELLIKNKSVLDNIIKEMNSDLIETIKIKKEDLEKENDIDIVNSLEKKIIELEEQLRSRTLNYADDNLLKEKSNILYSLFTYEKKCIPKVLENLNIVNFQDRSNNKILFSMSVENFNKLEALKQNFEIGNLDGKSLEKMNISSNEDFYFHYINNNYKNNNTVFSKIHELRNIKTYQTLKMFVDMGTNLKTEEEKNDLENALESIKKTNINNLSSNIEEYFVSKIKLDSNKLLYNQFKESLKPYRELQEEIENVEKIINNPHKIIGFDNRFFNDLNLEDFRTQNIEKMKKICFVDSGVLYRDNIKIDIFDKNNNTFFWEAPKELNLFKDKIKSEFILKSALYLKKTYFNDNVKDIYIKKEKYRKFENNENIESDFEVKSKYINDIINSLEMIPTLMAELESENKKLKEFEKNKKEFNNDTKFDLEKANIKAKIEDISFEIEKSMEYVRKQENLDNLALIGEDCFHLFKSEDYIIKKNQERLQILGDEQYNKLSLNTEKQYLITCKNSLFIKDGNYSNTIRKLMQIDEENPDIRILPKDFNLIKFRSLENEKKEEFFRLIEAGIEKRLFLVEDSLLFNDYLHDHLTNKLNYDNFIRKISEEIHPENIPYILYDLEKTLKLDAEEIKNLNLVFNSNFNEAQAIDRERSAFNSSFKEFDKNSGGLKLNEEKIQTLNSIQSFQHGNKVKWGTASDILFEDKYEDLLNYIKTTLQEDYPKVWQDIVKGKITDFEKLLKNGGNINDISAIQISGGRNMNTILKEIVAKRIFSNGKGDLSDSQIEQLLYNTEKSNPFFHQQIQKTLSLLRDGINQDLFLEVNQDRIKQLSKEVKTLNVERGENKKDLEEKQESQGELNKQVEELKTQEALLEGEISTLKHTLEIELKNEGGADAVKIDAIKKNIEEKEKQLKKVSGDKTSTEIKLNTANTEVQKLGDNSKNYNNTLLQKQQLLSNLNNSIQDKDKLSKATLAQRLYYNSSNNKAERNKILEQTPEQMRERYANDAPNVPLTFEERKAMIDKEVRIQKEKLSLQERIRRGKRWLNEHKPFNSPETQLQHNLELLGYSNNSFTPLMYFAGRQTWNIAKSATGLLMNPLKKIGKAYFSFSLISAFPWSYKAGERFWTQQGIDVNTGINTWTLANAGNFVWDSVTLKKQREEREKQIADAPKKIEECMERLLEKIKYSKNPTKELNKLMKNKFMFNVIANLLNPDSQWKFKHVKFPQEKLLKFRKDILGVFKENLEYNINPKDQKESVNNMIKILDLSPKTMRAIIKDEYKDYSLQAGKTIEKGKYIGEVIDLLKGTNQRQAIRDKKKGVEKNYDNSYYVFQHYLKEHVGDNMEKENSEANALTNKEFTKIIKSFSKMENKMYVNSISGFDNLFVSYNEQIKIVLEDKSGDFNNNSEKAKQLYVIMKNFAEELQSKIFKELEELKTDNPLYKTKVLFFQEILKDLDNFILLLNQFKINLNVLINKIEEFQAIINENEGTIENINEEINRLEVEHSEIKKEKEPLLKNIKDETIKILENINIIFDTIDKDTRTIILNSINKINTILNKEIEFINVSELIKEIKYLSSLKKEFNIPEDIKNYINLLEDNIERINELQTRENKTIIELEEYKNIKKGQINLGNSADTKTTFMFNDEIFMDKYFEKAIDRKLSVIQIVEIYNVYRKNKSLIKNTYNLINGDFTYIEFNKIDDKNFLNILDIFIKNKNKKLNNENVFLEDYLISLEKVFRTQLSPEYIEELKKANVYENIKRYFEASLNPNAEKSMEEKAINELDTSISLYKNADINERIKNFKNGIIDTYYGLSVEDYIDYRLDRDNNKNKFNFPIVLDFIELDITEVPKKVKKISTTVMEIGQGIKEFTEQQLLDAQKIVSNNELYSDIINSKVSEKTRKWLKTMGIDETIKGIKKLNLNLNEKIQSLKPKDEVLVLGANFTPNEEVGKSKAKTQKSPTQPQQ